MPTKDCKFLTGQGKRDSLITECRKSFFFFMTCNIFLAFFVFFLVPETKGVPLEEIDVLFGGANHIEKGGDLLHVEDAHHAHVGVDNNIAGGEDTIEQVQGNPESQEIKM
jgi:hypothetical protein